MTSSRLLIIACALGALAALSAASLSGTDGATATPGFRAVVARSEIPFAAAPEPESLELRRFPGEARPPYADIITDPASVSGRSARRKIAAGTALRDSDFWPVLQGPGARVADGMRAYTAAVQDLSRVAGFEGPGSRVDILLSASRNVSQPFSRIILSDVQVLEVKGEARGAAGLGGTGSLITLEVTPRGAERLDLARQLGELTAVTGKPGAAADGHPSGARVADLSGEPRDGPRAATGPAELLLAPLNRMLAPTRATAPRAADGSVMSTTARPTVVVEEIRGGSVTRREGTP